VTWTPKELSDAWLDMNGSASETTAGIDGLWAGRIVPFEANLRAGRRAPRRQRAVLVDPDPAWARQATRLIDRLRHGAGSQIIRADHIGSTSVSGLPAKQLIDIQVVVSGLAAAHVAESARRAGFVRVPGQWFGTDRHGTDHPEEVVVDADPGRPVNVNIRPLAAPIWRETLLFRDWLRSHDEERDAYAAMKRELAPRPSYDVDAYSQDKMRWISAALARAERWADSTTWSPAP
jgi:dephospho-CoA kinase